LKVVIKIVYGAFNIISDVVYGPRRSLQPGHKAINDEAGMTPRESIPRLMTPVLGQDWHALDGLDKYGMTSIHDGTSRARERTSFSNIPEL
jgi:hypothetical protein